ncbi:hypothetical protein JHK84_052314 [Glycine max]|nr:hypothetical protein JHK85_053129 [Glycine max]KAG5082276.1 hypothetical protein JHK84_052314 [Glycine max]
MNQNSCEFGSSSSSGGALRPPNRLNSNVFASQSQSNSVSQRLSSPNLSAASSHSSLATSHAPLPNCSHALQLGHSLPPHKGHRRCSSESPIGITDFIQSVPESVSSKTWSDCQNLASRGGNSGFEKPIQLVLKFKTNKSKKVLSWNQSIDFCEWRGVACDEEGQVTGLDLSGESMYGGFDNSSTLFSLQNLQILNLSANNFSYEIPSGLNKLKNLTYLNLSHAGFVGQIPTEISSLTRLVTLDMSCLSYLYGQPLKLENIDLQMLVRNLTMLRQLYMDGVIVTTQGNTWSNALFQLVSLQELTMSNCNLSGPLDPSLTRL